jgi:hypothetical protein
LERTRSGSKGIAIDMEPEDGRLIVWNVGENGVSAFTDFGIENLQQIIKDLRANGKGRSA